MTAMILQKSWFTLRKLKKNSEPQRGFTIVAPKIFGSYEEDGLLKVFVTTFSTTYKLYDKVLDEVTGSVIPSAITFKKDNNGNYKLEKYEQAKDGAYWQSSIRGFCTMPVSGKKYQGLRIKYLTITVIMMIYAIFSGKTCSSI